MKKPEFSRIIHKKRRILRETMKFKSENLTVVPLTSATNTEALITMIMEGQLLPARFDE
jgi:hypothetical protein